MCMCVKETEERGTDWYTKGKEAAGETSEARVILGEYSSWAIIKGGDNTAKKKNRQTKNKLSDRENHDSEEGRRKERQKTEQECTTAEQRCHMSISLQ